VPVNTTERTTVPVAGAQWTVTGGDTAGTWFSSLTDINETNAASLGFAWAYVRYGSVPQVKGVLSGVKPVIIVIVLQALWSLGRTALKTKLLAGIGIAGIILSFLGLHELLVLLGGGLIVMAVRLSGEARKGQRSFRSLISASPLVIFLQTGTATASFSLAMLFLFFHYCLCAGSDQTRRLRHCHNLPQMRR